MGMNIFWVSLAGQLVSVIPCHVLAYYPFRDHLKIRIWKIVALLSLIQSVTSVSYAYTATLGTPRWELQYLAAPLSMLVFFICVQADRFKLLFLYIFVMDYTLVTRGIAASLSVRLLHGQGTVPYVQIKPLIQLAVLAVSFPFMLRFFNSAKNRVLQIDAPYFWRTAWLVPALTTVIVLIYTGVFTPEQAQSWQFLLTRFLLLVCMFLVYSSLLRSLDTFRRQTALAEQAALQENMLVLQQTQYDQLLRYMDQIRTARHDLRHHWEAVRAYLDAQDPEGLRSYLDAYGKELPVNTQQLFCKNLAVNAVLNFYAETSRREQIEFTANMNLPDTLPVSEPELCALLGNLLENALDACREVKKKAPFIRLGGYADGNHVVLTVDNSCENVPARENDRFLSSKHSGCGIGTSSVRSTAERTGGTAELSCKDGVFYASVLLYGSKNETAD